MKTATQFPEFIETQAEYDELQVTGVLPDAAAKRMREANVIRLREFNERRANADPKDDPTNWDRAEF